MNSTMRFINCLFLGMIAVMLLGLSPLYASEDSVPGLIVKGTLLHKDGTPVINKKIYFFAVFYIKNSKELSVKTSFQNGRIANPSNVTNDKGLFKIKITSDFLKKTESTKFSVGLLGGFGPGFSILRNQEGIAATIDINPNTVATAQSDTTIDMGKIILNP